MCVCVSDFLDATQEHHKFAVNAGIVDHEFGTPEGSVHLAAAGIKPVRHRQPVPHQGCVPLQHLTPGCVITTHTQPGPDAAAEVTYCGWGQQLAELSSGNDAAGVAAHEDCGGYQLQWPGPEPATEQLPRQEFAEALERLRQASMLSQPRLLAAISLYQACFASISHLQLVDTQMGELLRPVQLGAFLALQRLHLENIAELLQTDWAIKVRVCVCCGSGCS